MSKCPLLLNDRIECVSQLTFNTVDSFAKSFQFSPDGAFALTATEGDVAVVSRLPKGIQEAQFYQHGEVLRSNNKSLDFHETKRIPMGESIYDLKWHSSSNQCFASTCRDHPITLWNTGSTKAQDAIICTYRGYDNADELEAAVCISFNLAGDKLYSGSNRMIRCFDVATPGRDCASMPTTPTKKSNYGQKGLISTIAFNPDYSGAFAAGSYADSIGIYVENSPDCALLLDRIGMGVTCLRWSPCGHYLWAGGRNHSAIQCWDIRATQTIVGSVHRELSSNQRISFDLDPWGVHLATGDQHGRLLFYDAKTFQLMRAVDTGNGVGTVAGEVEAGGKGGMYDRQLGHDDSNVSRDPVCVNSVAFHPYSAVLGLAAGQRVFAVNMSGDSDSESESDDGNSARRAACNSSSSSAELHQEEKQEQVHTSGAAECKEESDSANSASGDISQYGRREEGVEEEREGQAKRRRRCYSEGVPARGEGNSLPNSQVNSEQKQQQSTDPENRESGVSSDTVEQASVSVPGKNMSKLVKNSTAASCLQLWRMSFTPQQLPMPSNEPMTVDVAPLEAESCLVEEQYVTSTSTSSTNEQVTTELVADLRGQDTIFTYCSYAD